MNTECTLEQLEFHGLGRCDVIGKFDGGKMSSDGGGVLLRLVDIHTSLWVAMMSPCLGKSRQGYTSKL